MLEHGGRLRNAAAQYGIALEHWLDLSTGINPLPWCGPPVPRLAWARLPESDDGLLQAAQQYYGAPSVLPVAGSQSAIMHLPRLRASSRVAVVEPSYAEHALRWREAGHAVSSITIEQCAAAAESADVLILVNPNNPTGSRINRMQLLRWHERLAARGGWLLIDEAFADPDPTDSVASFTDRDGLIVLRSFGKFFGLAGARVGFVLGTPSLLSALDAQLGPWPLAGPARFIARRALTDHRWHLAMRTQLQALAQRLKGLLQRHGLTPAGGCSLFQWVPTSHATAVHDALARQGILTRLFRTPQSLRFGLPAEELHWQRLEFALTDHQRDCA